MITWNSRYFIKNQYLFFVGIAYFFIAFLDLMHTLSYKGMPIFTDYDFYANQLWIGARYLESVTLVTAFLFSWKRIRFLAGKNIFCLYDCYISLDCKYFLLESISYMLYRR